MDRREDRERYILIGGNQSMFEHWWEKIKKIQNTYESDRIIEGAK